MTVRVRCCQKYIKESVLGRLRPPLWSSGQSSLLQIRRSGFYSLRYQIFWEVVGLERGPLSLVSTIEELLERKSCGFGIESREYGRRDPLCWPRNTLYPQKLAVASQTNGGRVVRPLSCFVLFVRERLCLPPSACFSSAAAYWISMNFGAEVLPETCGKFNFGAFRLDITTFCEN
jgi:hypothetical protein